MPASVKLESISLKLQPRSEPSFPSCHVRTHPNPLSIPNRRPSRRGPTVAAGVRGTPHAGSGRLANAKPGQTLQATALVHEAYLRLVDAEKAQHWDSRGHFFAAAAEAMRRILVDRARGGKCSQTRWRFAESRPYAAEPKSLDRTTI